MSLALVLLADRPLEGFLLLGGPVAPAALELIALHRREHARGLLAAHDGDACIRPLKQQPWRIRPPAHRVVTGAIAAADNDGELRPPGTRDRRHQLRAVLGDAAGFGAPADH